MISYNANNYPDFDSRIYYVKDGKEYTIANFKSDRYDEYPSSPDCIED